MPILPAQTRIKCLLGTFPVLSIEPTGDMYIIHFQIHTIVGHSIIPFKPNLKPGDEITLYTEIERAQDHN